MNGSLILDDNYTMRNVSHIWMATLMSLKRFMYDEKHIDEPWTFRCEKSPRQRWSSSSVTSSSSRWWSNREFMVMTTTSSAQRQMLCFLTREEPAHQSFLVRRSLKPELLIQFLMVKLEVLLLMQPGLSCLVVIRTI